MAEGDIQDTDSSHLVMNSSDVFEQSATPPVDRSLQRSYLDALALSAAEVASSSWDAEIKKKARAIYDQTLWTRSLFGALDGLIISYSAFKYIFDYITPADMTSVDVMHDWMMTEWGAFGACSGSLAIITLSLVGNIFDDDHKNPLIRSMAMIWPYVRDGFKGLKFAYKGLRSTIQVAQLTGCDLRAMIFPMGLVLGVAAAANRIWYRSQVTEKRKEYQKFNNVLLKRAQNLGLDSPSPYELLDGAGVADDALKTRKIYLTLPPEEDVLEYKLIDPSGEIVKGKLSIKNDLTFNELDSQGKSVPPTLDKLLSTHYYDKILRGTCLNGHTATENSEKNREQIREAIKGESLLPNRSIVIASALFGGFIDGLYTYMGAMGIAILSPPLFGAMLVCCAVFTVICVINRYYEEAQFQNEFLRSGKNVELVLAAKVIKEQFLEWQALSVLNAKHSRQVGGNKEADLTSRMFDEKSKIIDKRLREELIPAFAARKKEFDDIYDISTGRAILIGLRSGLYFYSAVSSIIFAYAAFCTAFPPVLFVTAVALGILSLTVFAAHAVIVNNAHTAKLKETRDQQQQKNSGLASYVKTIKKTFEEAQEIPPLPVGDQDPLMDSMPIGPVPQLDYQPTFEIIRSCCSGLPKGNKGIDFMGEYWLEPDSQGHYQEASWMMPLGVVFSIFYAVVYALRAFGKGFRGANDVPIPTLPRQTDVDGLSGTISPVGSDSDHDAQIRVSPVDGLVGQQAMYFLGVRDSLFFSAKYDERPSLLATAAGGGARPSSPCRGWILDIFGNGMRRLKSGLDLPADTNAPDLTPDLSPSPSQQFSI